MPPEMAMTGTSTAAAFSADITSNPSIPGM
jgi:hypothetical protein